MPKLTYAQIREMQLQYGQESMPVDAFARAMNKATGSNDYDAGVGTGLGSVLHKASYAVDSGLSYTGMPQFFGDVGEGLFGQAGRTAFEGVPRMAVDSLPLVVGGPVGVIGSAAAQGVNTYGQTDSGLAGGVSAAFGAALGPLAKGTGNLAVKGFGALGGNVATVASKMSAAGLAGLGKVAPSTVTQALSKDALLGIGARASKFAGEQAGLLGGTLAMQGTTNAIVAEPGQKWDAFKSTFDTPNIAANVLAQGLFGASSAFHAFKRSPEVRNAQEFNDTYARYNNEVLLPREQLSSLRSAVEERMNTLALPSPGESPGARMLRQQARLDANAARNKQNLGEIAVADTPLLGPSLVEKVDTAVVQPPSAVVEAVKTQAKAAGLPETAHVTELPLDNQVALLNSPDPIVAAHTTLAVNNVPAKAVAEDVKAVVAQGLDPLEALSEKLQREKAKAAKRDELVQAAKAKRDAEAQAKKDAKAQEAKDWYKQWSRDKKNTEADDVLQDALSYLDTVSQKYASTTILNKVRAWSTSGTDIETLKQEIGGALKRLGSKRRNEASSLPVVGYKDGVPQVASVKGQTRHVFESREAAQQAQRDAKDTYKEWAWHVAKIGSKAKPRYTLMRSDWENVSASELDQNRVTSVAEVASGMDALQVAPVKAKNVAQSNVVKVVTDVPSYLDSLPGSAWQDTPLSPDPDTLSKLSVVLHEVQASVAKVKGKNEASQKMGSLMDRIMQHGKFESEDAAQSFMMDAMDLISGYKNALAQKFLGISPKGAGISAGGGFFYNLGAFDNKAYKLGKHPIAKSGRISEAVFTRIGRGGDQPLSKSEVELYKVLVPEAFTPEGLVDVPKLYELLPQREPVVEIKKLRADENNAEQAGELRIAAIEHNLDTLDPNWLRYQQDPELQRPADVQRLMEERDAIRDEFTDYSGETPRDARYMSVAPKTESDMPGYVEGLVRVPIDRSQLRTNYEGGITDHGDDLLYRGPHFGSEDTNVLGFFRGYMETLPDGTKAFHVIEVQSDWGQQVRKADATRAAQERDAAAAGFTRAEWIGVPEHMQRQEPNHPLLPAYENLTIKAAIRHAREQGATKLILSDAETAMMSEGHDVGGAPAQEKGMRLHYDTTLPSEMKKITGERGTPVDLGVHDKIKAQPHINGPLNEDGIPGTITLERPATGGSPVFKNPDGTPKTNITGKLYDISRVDTGDNSITGKGLQFGEGQSSTGLVGERMFIGKLLQEVGLSAPEHQAEAARLLSLYDNGDISFAKLMQQEGQNELGLFTQQTDGQKLVWLSAQKDANRTMFVLAHELNGHGLWKLHAEGKLDAESSNRLNRYQELIGDNTAEQNQILLREAWDMLPEKYKKDTGLRDLVEARSSDPDEVLANLNAIISLGMVNAKASKWTEFMRWLPKPVSDFIAVAAKYGRKFVETVSGTLFKRRLDKLDGIEPEQEKLLNDYVDTIYGVLKVDSKRTAEVEQAIRASAVNDQTVWSNMVEDGRLLTTGVDSETAKIVQAFKGTGDESVGYIRGKLRKLSKGYDAWLQPIMRVAKTRPEFQRAASASVRQEMRTQSFLTDVMKKLTLDWDGVKWKVDKNSSVLRVEQDAVMSKVRDDIVRRAQVTESNVADNILAKDKETLVALSRLSPENQRLVRESVEKTREAQALTNDYAQQMQYEKLVYSAAKAMMHEDGALKSVDAERKAREIVQLVKDGKYSGPDTATSAFVSASDAKIKRDFKFFNDRPWWVSEQRFGDYEISWTYKDPNRPRGYYKAKTEQEMIVTLQELEARKKSGEISEVKSKTLERKPFDAREAALNLWATREAESNEALVGALASRGIDPMVARELVESHSAVADMQRELAMKALPNRSVARKFADGREMLDTLQQQLDSTNVLIHGLSKAIANAEHSMYMQDPEVLVHPDRGLFVDAWKQFRTPDSKAVSSVQKFNYYSFLSFNYFNMLQDAVQPITGALVPDLIADKRGVASSYGLVMKSMAKLGTGKLAADEKSMLDRYRKGNRGLASYSDEMNNSLVSAIDIRRLVDGKDQIGTAHLAKSKLGAVLLWNKKFHKKFTDFGMEASVLAAYEHMKSKGLGNAEAERAAIEFATTSMASWGKGGRAVGVWSADKLRPVSAAMTSLQTFAFNQIGAMKNYLDTVLSSNKNLTREHRVAATKAFGAHTAMMFAHAGLLGLPFVGAALTLVDKVFGINSREAISAALSDDEAATDGTDYGVNQIALHGLFNMLGGDIASRSATQGVLGINAREGFSADAALGSTYAMLNKVFEGTKKAASSAGEGNLAGAAGELVQSVMPNQIQRALQFWREDNEFRRKDGSLIAETSNSEKAVYSLLGLKPTRVANAQERDSWQRIDAEIEQQERSQWLGDVLEKLDEGDAAGARAAIAQRAQQKNEEPQALATALASKLVDRTVGKDVRKDAGYSERLGLATGAPLPQVSEAQRLMMVQQVMRSIGFRVPFSRFRTASAVDAARESRPWLPRRDAIEQYL